MNKHEIINLCKTLIHYLEEKEWEYRIIDSSGNQGTDFMVQYNSGNMFAPVSYLGKEGEEDGCAGFNTIEDAKKAIEAHKKILTQYQPKIVYQQ